MKNKLLIGLFAFFTVLNFTACDVEPLDPNIIVPEPEDPNNPNPNDPGSFKVDFDGNTYTALTTQVFVSESSILLTALRANGDSFGFIIDATQIGAYPANENLLAFNPSGSQYGYWSINPEDDTANTGTITITEINTANHTISGTFNFTGYWSNTDETVAPKQFTNGIFTNLPYVTDSPTGDTFTATVDGTAFTAGDILTAETSVGGMDFISVAGQSGETAITVSVKSDIDTGSYPITGSPNTDMVQVVFTNPDGNGGLATTGTVIITEITADRVKGTFTATVVDGTQTFQITNGTFDAAY
ncbi:MAG: hypothetical protein EOO50_08820 [Flavobacterium sp.]|uniref:DUF6252 family protein n=1 Tax=Flavobacterium sp. TaxID=239 RepID=UPI00120FEB08|nr:DUF6252 family protein [Flavobacterium sp.]RZJ66618.1 MAG: hypothetical protein EOO50_08820 [Flavobacterium sp.]